MKKTEIFADHGSSDYTDTIVDHAFFKLMKLYPNKILYFFAIILSLAMGSAPLIMNVFMGDMVDSLMPGKDFFNEFIPVLLHLIYLFIAFIVINFINTIVVPASSRLFVKNLRIIIFDNIMKQDIEFFDQTSTGILINRMTEDVVLVDSIYMNKFMTTLQSIARFFGGIILSFYTAWEPSFISLAAIIICVITFFICDTIIEKLWKKYYVTVTASSLKVEEVLTSFRTVKSFDNELQEAQEYESSLNNLNKVSKKTSGVVGTKVAIIGLIIPGVISIVSYYFSYIITRHPEKGYVPGDLVVLMLCTIFAVNSVNSLIALSDDMKKARISSSKILKIIEMKPENDPKEGRKLSELKGTIEFRNVSFKYPAHEEYALKDLSFKISEGETVAFVGESGCGKSTTLQLIQKFYEPGSGEILIDGIDIRDLSANCIRSHISVVPQSPVLFSMSVKDNIRFAKPKASLEKVIEAATIGNAHNFICEMPEEYSTMATQTSMSGGQKQRICISRAIMKNSTILLLDEATAALDTESEQLVRQSIEKVRKGKTAIIVAHQLATVRNADRILVFKDGTIAEEGTHDDLLSLNGIYSDLVRFQLQ